MLSENDPDRVFHNETKEEFALVKEAAPVRAATPPPTPPAETQIEVPVEAATIVEPLAATIQVDEKPPEPATSPWGRL